MSRRIDAETRAKIVAAYLENDRATYKEIGEQFGINQSTISKIIKTELEAVNGVKPDRRINGELTDDALDQKHGDVISAKDPHPRTLGWMEHIKPLNAHKRELEQKVEHKQAELEKAKQELRDFTATLRQLMEDTV